MGEEVVWGGGQELGEKVGENMYREGRREEGKRGKMDRMRERTIFEDIFLGGDVPFVRPRVTVCLVQHSY